MTPAQYEHEVLVHRFLYYVMAEPVISDFEYDVIEREARAVLPPESVVHKVGSSLPTSYSAEVQRDAMSRV